MSDRFTHAEMASEIAKLVWSKETWLTDHAHGQRKRPDHEIETRTHELLVLRQAEADYRRAAERNAS